MTRRCKHCKNVELKPAGQCAGIVEKKGFCSIDCLTALTREKRLDSEEKRKSKEIKQRKKALNESSIQIQKPLAQKAFNRYVRLYRYHVLGDRNCISCNRHESEIDDKGFGKFDCGHFRSVGAAPELRFRVDNAYLQCKSCNGGSGKYARKNETVGIQYEANLRLKVGDALVDELKGPHDLPNLIAADYVEIKNKFNRIANEISKNIE